jgi:hypothetical protein
MPVQVEVVEEALWWVMWPLSLGARTPPCRPSNQPTSWFILIRASGESEWLDRTRRGLI